MPVQHRTRPLLCHAGLHRPAWVRFPAAGWTPTRVCAGCGILIEGAYWDTAATTMLVITPLLAAAAGCAAGAALARTHRGRR